MIASCFLGLPHATGGASGCWRLQASSRTASRYSHGKINTSEESRVGRRQNWGCRWRTLASSRDPDFFTGSTGDREVREELIADCALGSTRLTWHRDCELFLGLPHATGGRFGLLATASLVEDCLEIFSREDQHIGRVPSRTP